MRSEVVNLLVALMLATALIGQPSVASVVPVGFASIDHPTTGGGEGEPVIVRTAMELQRELERLDITDKKRRATTPRIIRLAGDIDLAVLANDKPGKDLKQTGIIYPCSNTTLEGPPGGATLRHGTIELKGTKNVIIRNLRFRDHWEYEPTGQ